MRRLTLFLVYVLANLGFSVVHAAQSRCQNAQLTAAAKLCDGILQCEAKALKQSASRSADNACLERRKAGFPRTYDKALAREARQGGSCPSDETGDRRLSAWLADINGPTPLAGNAVGSINSLVRQGATDSKISRSLYSALLKQTGKTCDDILTAYADNARRAKPAKFASRLSKSRKKFIADSSRLIARAQTKGFAYQGNAAGTLFDRIALMAEQRMNRDTAGESVKPQPTSQGEPTGEKTTAEIGSAGGTITASNGLLKLSIPEGAISSPTVIGIQAISNHMPGGHGLAYRFEPDGIQFAKPVTVSLSYVPGETDPRNLGMAYQDRQGYWHGLSDPVAVDETTKTVAFEVSHFSDWAFYEKWWISPDNAELYTGEALKLYVFHSDFEEDDLLVPLAGNADIKEWSVNGIKDGSGAVGTIGGGANATYSAPAEVPANNPVAVAALVDTHTPGTGQLQVISNIRVKPKGWNGFVKVELQMSGSITDPVGSKLERSLDYSTLFPVRSTISEALGEVDGTGKVEGQLLLELGRPAVQMDRKERFDAIYEGNCGNYHFENSSSRELAPEVASIWDQTKVPVTVFIQRDKRSRLPYGAPVFPLKEEVVSEKVDCSEGVPLPAVRETFVRNFDIVDYLPADLELVGEVSSDGKHFRGKVARVVKIDATSGTLTVTWDFARD